MERGAAGARVQPVDGGCTRAFGQAAALDDQQAECVEELRNLPGERCAPGNADADAAAQPLQHLSVDELGGEPTLKLERKWDAPATLLQRTDAVSDAHCPIDQLPLDPRL